MTSKSKRPKLLEITPEDVGDHFHVEVSITPKSAQDQMMQAQLAQALRTPDATGHPAMSDEDINRMVFMHPHPERLSANVERQMYERTNPQVKEILDNWLWEQWKKENKEANTAFEKLQNPDGEKEITMTMSKFQQAVEIAVKDKMAQMQGMPGAEQLLMAGAPMAAGGPAMADPNAPMPEVGGGMAQAVLPEQYQMTPADMIPEPAATQAKQTKRGKPQHKVRGLR